MNILLSLLTSKTGQCLLIALIVLLACLAFRTWEKQRIEDQARDKYSKLVSEIKAAEYEKREKELKEQQRIVSEYAAKIEELQRVHDETLRQIEAGDFRDVIHVPVFVHDDKCSGVQRQDGNSKSGVQKTGNSGDLVCYTGEQLQRKVKDSMAIAEECDRLAERYKSLLEVCRG